MSDADTGSEVIFPGEEPGLGETVERQGTVVVFVRQREADTERALRALGDVPQELRADAMKMLKTEQRHRHEREMLALNTQRECAMKAQDRAYRLESMRLVVVAVGDMLGRLMVAAVAVVYVAAVGYALWTGRYGLAGLFLSPAVVWGLVEVLGKLRR